MMDGLTERDLNYIQEGLKKMDEIEKAVIFGSRAMENNKKGSDVDLAIFGREVTTETLASLDQCLNEMYPLPYFFDIIHYDSLINERLKEHIDRLGKEIYSR